MFFMDINKYLPKTPWNNRVSTCIYDTAPSNNTKSSTSRRLPHLSRLPLPSLFPLDFLSSADPSSTIYGLYSHKQTNKQRPRKANITLLSWKAKILLTTVFSQIKEVVRPKMKIQTPQVQENTINCILMKATCANKLTDSFLFLTEAAWYYPFTFITAMHQKRTFMLLLNK